MAKFYQSLDGNTGLRLNSEEESRAPIPAGASVIEFDAETNQSFIDSLAGKSGFKHQDHAIVGGQIRRAGIPFVLSPDSTAKQDRDDFKTNLATALTRLDAIITQAGAGMTNPQRDAAIGDLSRIVKRMLRRIIQELKE